jgi:predicted GNAT family acetyltransferase
MEYRHMEQRMAEPGDVIDNVDAHRFELQVDGETAFLQYERTNESLALIHTEVPERLRGQRLGERLVVAALESGRAAGLRIIAICPYVRQYLRKHPLT